MATWSLIKPCRVDVHGFVFQCQVDGWASAGALGDHDEAVDLRDVSLGACFAMLEEP